MRDVLRWFGAMAYPENDVIFEFYLCKKGLNSKLVSVLL